MSTPPDLYTIITTNAPLNSLIQSLATQGLNAANIGQVVYTIFALYESSTAELTNADLSALIVKCFDALVLKYQLIPPAGLADFNVLVQCSLAVCLQALPALEREVAEAVTSCWAITTACCKKPNVQP